MSTFNKNVLIILSVLLSILMYYICYSGEVIDKQGKIVYDIVAPTAESKIDPDTISNANRHIVDAAKDYSRSSYEGANKNIYSDNTIIQDSSDSKKEFSDYIKTLYDNKYFELIKEYGELTNIRHTSSITNVDGNKYELYDDPIKGRLRMKVYENETGVFEAKNGYFKIDGKIYYFDENGLMVLGPAIDSSNNYYFFSYDTGELLN